MKKNNIRIGARTIIRKYRPPRVINRIFLKKQEREIDILRYWEPKIHQPTLDEIPEISPYFIWNFAHFNEIKRVFLPAEEYFVSLMSYVHGIACIGLENLYRMAIECEAFTKKSLPLGFKLDFQSMIQAAISTLIPTVEWNPLREILIQAATSSDPSFRRVAAMHPATPKEYLTKLAEDADREVRIALAGHHNIDKIIIKKLKNDQDLGVKVELTHNFLVSREEAALIYKSMFKKGQLVKNPNTPPDVLEELVHDSEDWIRKRVAENPNTPAVALAVLIRDLSNRIRKTAARHQNLTMDQINLLARDQHQGVRKHLLSNPNVSVEILQLLSADTSFRVRSSVARHKLANIDIFKKLCCDPDWRVRRHVALNPCVPIEISRLLAEDDVERVREAVDRNPSTQTNVSGKFTFANPIENQKIETQLTQIWGIGPGRAKMLRKANIFTKEQILETEDAELKKILKRASLSTIKAIKQRIG